MDKTRKIATALVATTKVLCVVACVCCFGIVLGTAGAVDVAGDSAVHGWVWQMLFGLCGMAAFGTLAGKMKIPVDVCMMDNEVYLIKQIRDE